MWKSRPLPEEREVHRRRSRLRLVGGDSPAGQGREGQWASRPVVAPDLESETPEQQTAPGASEIVILKGEGDSGLHNRTDARS
ncbi:hypothetical protein GCM10010472_30700 [Pseudonocardia halophobica]|uniref:Uncharacterized protein n=1 Tax=Pseudonocardia halophobica TaxID=29401 RepID=A0A9W6NU22_9PSEU|nr:hypothetical protein GCM10017577_04690 [Pseudonocardia halophobica]